MNTQQIAEAFSSHRFDEVYDRLDELVAWVVPGQEPNEGKAAVITTCTGAAAEFSGMASASFGRFVSVGNDSTAAVDAIGRYKDQYGSVSVVSSADIYEFSAQGQVVRITSYAVELCPRADDRTLRAGAQQRRAAFVGSTRVIRRGAVR